MNTWREENIFSRSGILVAICGTNCSLVPGCILNELKNRPSIVGEDNCIEAAVKKLPIHLTILPET